MALVSRCVLCVAVYLVLAACVSRSAPTVVDGATQPPAAPSAPSEPAPTTAQTWPPPGDDLTEPMEALPPGAKPPPFPDSVVDYSLTQEWRETVRAFDGADWSTMHEFPATMNGCDLQCFYIRWRAANSAATVEATFLSSPDGIVLGDPVAGAAGWMSGYGCGHPAFRLESSTDESTLTDVVVEVQQWEISV